jgi:hypothetical protein
MTRSRRSADRSRRLVGGLAIALALVWSATAHLLWQVESRQGKNQPPAVRLVLSALQPSSPQSGTPGQQPSGKKAPRSVSQPVLPDGETPAPCQIRRSLTSDVEVLAALKLPVSMAEPAVLADAGMPARTVARTEDRGPDARSHHVGPTASLPRPPPSWS